MILTVNYVLVLHARHGEDAPLGLAQFEKKTNQKLLTEGAGRFFSCSAATAVCLQLPKSSTDPAGIGGLDREPVLGWIPAPPSIPEHEIHKNPCETREGGIQEAGVCSPSPP